MRKVFLALLIAALSFGLSSCSDKTEEIYGVLEDNLSIGDPASKIEKVIEDMGWRYEYFSDRKSLAVDIPKYNDSEYVRYEVILYLDSDLKLREISVKSYANFI